MSTEIEQSLDPFQNMSICSSNDISEFRHVFQSRKNIVAVVGAGLSKASGIPTYRDRDGLWTRYDPTQLSTPQAFAADPSLVWQFYNTLRTASLNAVPNAGHLALAVLGIPMHLRVLAPDAKFTLVTQNIDGLDVRALEQVKGMQQETESEPLARIFEIHGRLLDTLCTVCEHRESRDDISLCPALADSPSVDSPKQIPLENLPRCRQPGCGALLRPGIVWFEETPRHMREVWATVDEADLCLVIGTSATVSPAAGFAYTIADHGGKVAVFNIEHSDEADRPDFLFLGPCEETLPRVLFG